MDRIVRGQILGAEQVFDIIEIALFAVRAARQNFHFCLLVTTVIGSFQIFDTIAITTKGGPVGVTRVLFWYIYEFAFSRFKMGFAMAAAVVLFAILITITLIQMRFLRANESDMS